VKRGEEKDGRVRAVPFHPRRRARERENGAATDSRFARPGRLFARARGIFQSAALNMP
jgi:hypothetical protein